MRASVSEESLRAPSLTLVSATEAGENDREEDFPATSKQMSDRRPGGSASTAPHANGGGVSGWQPWCRSVHHPLLKCPSITASVRGAVTSTETRNTGAKETLSHCARPSSLSRLRISSFPHSPACGSHPLSLSLSPLLPGS